MKILIRWENYPLNVVTEILLRDFNTGKKMKQIAGRLKGGQIIPIGHELSERPIEAALVSALRYGN